MRKLSLTVSDEAHEILGELKRELGMTTLDETMDHILKHAKKKKLKEEKKHG